MARPSGEHPAPRPPRADGARTDDDQDTWRALQWAVDVLADLFETDRGASDVEQDDAARYGLDAGADVDAYRAWLLDIEQAFGTPPPAPSTSPLVSVFVILPGVHLDVRGLARCMASVRSQVHEAWELFVCHDGSCTSPARAEIDAMAAGDHRLRVVEGDSLVAACARALAGAAGELVTVVDPNGELTPDALAELARWGEADPGADLVYSDEDELDEDGRPGHPRFKPDWSPDLLLSTPYLGHLVAMRRDLLDRIGGVHTGAGGDYDLMLRATEQARAVAHIPRVLYRCTRRPGGTDDATGEVDTPAGAAGEAESRRALTDALARRGIDAAVEPGLVPGTFRLRRAVRGEPTVSVIIPFRDQAPMLRSCVDSLHAEDAGTSMEIVLVDNSSVEPETRAVTELLCRRPGVRLLEHPGAFNWSAINNAAAATCDTDMLLFLNNDIVAHGRDWMTGLIEQAQRPEVGAVGCRLLYPDGAVQHAGVVLGMHVLAGHVMCGLPGDEPGYLGWAKVVRDTSAVSTACMMTRRAVFEELGGFDEEYAVAFNDVDFCLRLRRAGYSVVYTPFTELVHHESRTRGTSGFYRDYQAFLRTWTDEVRRGDPFYSVNLSRLDLRCKFAPSGRGLAMGDVAVEVDEFVRRVKARADGEAWAPPVPEPLTRAIDDRRVQDHPGLDHAHRHWALPAQPDQARRGPLGGVRARLDRLVFGALSHYLRDERELVSNLVQLNDALAKRCDELARAHRDLLQELDARFADVAAGQEHLARTLGGDVARRPGDGDG